MSYIIQHEGNLSADGEVLGSVKMLLGGYNETTPLEAIRLQVCVFVETNNQLLGIYLRP